MYRIEELLISRVSEFSKKITGRHLLIFIPSLWISVFFVFPCFILMKMSFSDSVLASPPYTNLVEWLSGSVLQIRINLGNYLILFTDEMYIRGFVTSILIAGISTACCLLIGFPMAYAIARSSKNVQNILLMLVVLPFWTSFLIRVYAWIMLLSPAGFVNSILMKMHMIDTPLQLMNNSYAACMGIIYAYLPFMVFPLYSAIEKIDYSMIEAALDLGSTPITVFSSIIVPLAAPGIYAGSLLVFISAIGEFVIPELLGSAETLTIGRLVWNEFFWNLAWPNAAALSIMLLLLVISFIMFTQKRREIKFVNQ
jgi:putrescine transport system permease protein